ncbi:MAG: zinc ABC transporter substrate-binding protein, partial [Burkholderiaceae bacterium]
MHIRFNRFSISALAAVLGTAISPGAMALTIFTCEPEWAALAGELAPDASITSATHARQDPHYVEARPSLIAQLRRADLAICTGAELEAGWLPVLQQRAANNKVQTGQIGMLFVSENVALLNPRDNVT